MVAEPIAPENVSLFREVRLRAIPIPFGSPYAKLITDAALGCLRLPRMDASGQVKRSQSLSDIAIELLRSTLLRFQEVAASLQMPDLIAHASQGVRKTGICQTSKCTGISYNIMAVGRGF